MTCALMASITDWWWRNHVRTLAAPSGLSNPTLTASAFSTSACTPKRLTIHRSPEQRAFNVDMNIPTQSTGLPRGAIAGALLSAEALPTARAGTRSAPPGCTYRGHKASHRLRLVP